MARDLSVRIRRRERTQGFDEDYLKTENAKWKMENEL